MASTSSGSSLDRTQTRTLRSTTSSRPSRRPRPRSPASMYVPYDTSMAEPPKPLIKLDKKPKNNTKAALKLDHVPPSSDDPVPCESPSVPFVSSSGNPHRRPSLATFINLRRKSTSASQSLSSSSGSLQNAHAGASAPSSHPPFPRRRHAPWPSLDSFDGSEPAPRHSDKGNRLLGKPLPELHNTFPPPGTLDASVSEFSGTFRLSPHSSPGEDASYKDDECFADDSHDQRESTLLSPVEFRPPSIAVFTAHPSDVDTASELDVEEQTPSEPVTPVAPFDPPQFRTPTNRRYSHSQPPHASDHKEDRPDTPSIGTLVAVNSQVLVARGSHTRHPSVVRIEPSWVGEWNQCDMQDVIQKLRSLK